DGRTRAVVAGLVARLDGMPLAVELAAGRGGALGVTGLRDRLDDRFALLTAGDRLAPSRQRSLAATVEWSYRLLEEDERRGVRAGAVFPGPVPLGAAGGVAERSRRERTAWCGCVWWCARCWGRRGRSRMAGPGTRCWRPCAATGPAS